MFNEAVPDKTVPDKAVPQETGSAGTRSARGLDYESVPWRLWEKSKKLFRDPADIDFTQDAVDWQATSHEDRTLVAIHARGFMVGEEAVTLDIVPLAALHVRPGRLEDTMYLSMFAMEEAKHRDFVREVFCGGHSCRHGLVGFCGDAAAQEAEALEGTGQAHMTSAASSNVCLVDDAAESFIVGVVVAPDDVQADHAGLLLVAGVVGPVEREVPQRRELRFYAV
jgi:hypothetical protein